jgi:hypothetical protein
MIATSFLLFIFVDTKQTHMKRKILLFSIILFSFFTHLKAQFSKGSTLLGADFGLADVKDETGASKQTDKSVNFYFSYGKAVKENLFVGGVLSTGFQNQESTNEQVTRKYNMYGAGGFVRKYIPVIRRFYIYGQADLLVSYYLTKSAYEIPVAINYTTKEWGLGLSAYPGVSYTLTKKFQLEAGFNNFFSITYTHNKQTNSNNNAVYKGGGFSIASNLNNLSYFNIGFRLLLQNS